jgi:mycofactocin precursor
MARRHAKGEEVAKVSTNEQLESLRAQELEQAPSRAAEAAPPEPAERPEILEEICVEELAIDGICGVY